MHAMRTRNRRAAPLHESDINAPAILTPLLATLPPACLARAACVSRAWASAECTDQEPLWRRHVLQDWPGLAAVARSGINWKERFRILRLQGCTVTRVDSSDAVLQRYTFVLQGRWAVAGPVAFSRDVRASKVTVPGDQLLLSDLVHPHVNAEALGSLSIADALQFELDLAEGVTFPSEWQYGPLEPQHQDAFPVRGIEMALLIHDTRDGSVAHFLSFTVPVAAIEYRHAAHVVRLADFWEANLPPTFVAEVDTLALSTHPGCGEPEADGSRQDVPWLATLGGEHIVGDLHPVLEVAPLSLSMSRMVNGSPRLTGLKMRISLQMDGRSSTGPFAGTCVAMPLQVSMLEGLCNSMEWA